MKDNNMRIYNEKEPNTHLTRLKGKIIRDEKCPLKKMILCEECEFYDGWGVDIKNHGVDVWCNNQNILKLSLTPSNIQKKGEESNRKKRFWKRKKNKI